MPQAETGFGTIVLSVPFLARNSPSLCSVISARVCSGGCNEAIETTLNLSEEVPYSVR